MARIPTPTPTPSPTPSPTPTPPPTPPKVGDGQQSEPAEIEDTDESE